MHPVNQVNQTVAGELRRAGRLREEGPGGLAGDQRLCRHDRKTRGLQHLLWLPAAGSLTTNQPSAHTQKQMHAVWQNSKLMSENPCLQVDDTQNHRQRLFLHTESRKHTFVKELCSFSASVSTFSEIKNACSVKNKVN